MGFLTRLLMALVGFAFTFGGFGNASAEDVKLGSDGAVVMARDKLLPTMSASVEELRKSVLASTGAQKPTKPTKPTKTKTKSPTKPKTKPKSI
jgi:hypothetical protein